MSSEENPMILITSRKHYLGIIALDEMDRIPEIIRLDIRVNDPQMDGFFDDVAAKKMLAEFKTNDEARWFSNKGDGSADYSVHLVEVESAEDIIESYLEVEGELDNV